MTPRILAIMGSGETTPTMTKPHRALFEQAGSGPAVIIDTPYGFQENADDISAKSVEYFAKSVGRTVDIAGLPSAEVDTLIRETALTRIRQAVWTFAGPGSPTYTLRQWSKVPVPELLADKLRDGGVVVFSSAAALTIGLRTVPVYEIYKAGDDPYWNDGLDLMAVTGLRATVIPHYNNAEGGHHDTRFCYLGERRLAIMEPMLPEDSFVLGVDEHTGLILDLDAGSATVLGLGVVTVRKDGRSVTFESGRTVSLDSLRAAAEGGKDSGTVTTAPTPAVHAAPVAAKDPFMDTTAGHERDFSAALERRDAASAAAAVLELEQHLVDWSADTLTGDQRDRARSALRSMVVRLGELAVGGARDPREALGPIVEIALAARRQARDDKDWARSDAIRDELAAAGIEVRDTPDGMVWELR